MKRIILFISALTAQLSLSAATVSETALREEVFLTAGWQTDSQSNVNVISNSFNVPYTDYGRHIDLCIDGVRGPYELSINGIPVSQSLDGRVPAVYDATPYLKYGETNTVSIAAESLTGPVRLIKTNPVHIDANGTRILTNWGKVCITTRITNDDFKSISDKSVAVIYNITGPYGESVLSSEQIFLELAPSQTGVVTSDFSVSVPFMWDFDARYTYCLKTTVYCGSLVVDETQTPFAFRDVEFHTKRGFLLNNRRVELVGVNLAGKPGDAVYMVSPELWRYRLCKIKESGFNAVRWTDGPAPSAMLDVCDEIGLLVIDDTVLDGPSVSDLGEFESVVARDANHPCIMLWSVIVPKDIANDERGKSLLGVISKKARLIDPQHRLFYAGPSGDVLSGTVDVIGTDDCSLKAIDGLHNAHPDQFLVGADACPSVEYWSFFEGRKNVGGFFIDEDKLFDSCSQPSDGALFIQTRTVARSMVQIILSGNGNARVYSNCDEVDLTAGKKVLARKKVSQDGYAEFTLPAKWTSLTARGYKRGAFAVSSGYAKSAELPVYTPSKTRMLSDGRDAVVFDVFCSQPFEFVFSGPARIAGWRNSESSTSFNSVSDTPDKVIVTPLDGRAQVIMESLPGQRGFVNVKVPGKKAPVVISVL